MISLPEPHSALIFLGLACLGMGFHKKDMQNVSYISATGWILFCLYFFLTSQYYLEINDPILVVMTAGCLPLGIVLATWEIKSEHDCPEALIWLRGAMFWAGFPYMLVDKVPWLNILAIWFVAWQTALYLRWTGAGDIYLEIRTCTWKGKIQSNGEIGVEIDGSWKAEELNTHFTQI